MADIDNLKVLHDLSKESIVRQLIEKTKSGDVNWTHIGGNEFSSTNGIWVYYIGKTQIGTISYRYNLDIRKNNVMYVTIVDGPLNGSNRDSQTKNLYEIIEVRTLGLNQKIQEALDAINAIVGS